MKRVAERENRDPAFVREQVAEGRPSFRRTSTTTRSTR